MWEDNTFSLEEVLLWIIDLYFDQKWWFKVKMICFFKKITFIGKQVM